MGDLSIYTSDVAFACVRPIPSGGSFCTSFLNAYESANEAISERTQVRRCHYQRLKITFAVSESIGDEVCS